MKSMGLFAVLGFAMVGVACGGEDLPAAKAPETTAVVAAPPVEATMNKPVAPIAPKMTLGEAQNATLSAWVDGMNAHDAKKVAAGYATDGSDWMPGKPEMKGQEIIEKGYSHFFAMAPDMKVWVARTVQDEAAAKTYVLWGWSGNSATEYMGAKIASKPVGGMVLSMVQFNETGKITLNKMYMNMAAFMVQTGQTMEAMGAFKGFAEPVPAPSTTAPVMMKAALGETQTKNINTVKSTYAAWEAKKEADFLAGLADDFEMTDFAAPKGIKGKAEAKKHFGMITKSMPDAKFAFSNAIASDDFVAVELASTGTFTGKFGTATVAKKPFESHEAMMFQVNSAGKIAKAWRFADNGEFVKGFGFKSAPPPAAKAPAAKAETKAVTPAAPKAPAAAAPKAK